ncbi:putative bifunctional diguanylate cyclase/phosphodiesterase [Thiomicrorhabdus sediminis]|uniref:EAL domain-containing protein n=1 Tax=Thiomicrorhabdus sediminis TaxID=2580412 RepID=A0A4P9K5Q4_9GAMM|nr:EAL domain-containing protein [Thiomicrorhabdus sediminis]QCU89596.1 EAL domain-containing protein [Thiomicrorhabdus sediminis]
MGNSFKATKREKSYVVNVLLIMSVAAALLAVEILYVRPSINQASGVLEWLLPVVLSLSLIIFARVYHHHVSSQRELTKLFKAVIDSSLEFTYVRDESGRYSYVSPAVERITGYSPDEFCEKIDFMSDIVHWEDVLKWQNYLKQQDGKFDTRGIEFRIISKSGQIRWLEHFRGPINSDDGKYLGMRAINIDITERKTAEIETRKKGFYDALTGLPNRKYLTQYINRSIERTELKNAESEFAVIFIDLNRFQFVNDAHGHSIGDALLEAVAKRFKTNCLDKNKAMITRFGGDEFVVVSRRNTSDESIKTCVSYMNELLETPFEIEGLHLSIAASAGVAVYPRDGVSAETLIKNADAAMYKAKKQGINMALFSHEMTQHATEMVDLHNKLKSAISQGMIQPHYQPLIDLSSNEIVGVEVLARWITEDGSIGPSPAVFIPLSEDSGLIWALSETMIAQAAKAIQGWLEQGVKIRFSVNVSAKQFAEDEFCAQMMEQFRRLSVTPQSVQIELTESVLIQNTEKSLEKIQMLKSAGFKIALDDFGTGYSSLQYLTQFPFDTLKVDRAFVTDIFHDERKFSVAKSIINLAHDLKLTVVAEGIETEEQRRVLVELGCDIGQGFLFSEPMAQDQLSEQLKVVNSKKA